MTIDLFLYSKQIWQITDYTYGIECTIVKYDILTGTWRNYVLFVYYFSNLTAILKQNNTIFINGNIENLRKTLEVKKILNYELFVYRLKSIKNRSVQ